MTGINTHSTESLRDSSWTPRRTRLGLAAAAIAGVATLLAACGSSGNGGGSTTAAGGGTTPAGGGAKSSAAPADVTLQLQWVTQAQFAGYIAALKQGFYQDQNLNVRIVPAGTDTVPQTTVDDGGSADFAITNTFQ